MTITGMLVHALILATTILIFEMTVTARSRTPARGGLRHK